MNEFKNVIGTSAGFRLYFNERDSDVTINVEHDGEKYQFPAHRLILSTMSEVLRAMLDVDMIEKSTKKIVINDSNPYAVKQFLKYLYMGLVDLNTWMEALTLLKIAHKYSVQSLIHLCETYLVTSITFNNACLLYEIARFYSLRSLKTETRNFILSGGFVVSATEGFFNLKSRSLEYFLSSPIFNVENEGSLLTSLREWAVCECSRKCVPLTRINILATMEPFLKYIQWSTLPESQRTYVPNNLVEKCRNDDAFRKAFCFPPSLQSQLCFVKFVLELGTYQEERLFACNNMSCVKFSTDNYAFLSGFRMVGLFQAISPFSTGRSFLALSRENGKDCIQFNLNSLPWTRGAVVGTNVWKEMIAYLPYPIRLDPFSTYVLSLRYNKRCKLMQSVKWPRTRLDTEYIQTNLGTIRLSTHNYSYGITQLFMLPAPPFRSICNRSDDD